MIDKSITKEREREAELINRLFSALYETRNHPGISLKTIASLCGQVFDRAEMEAFIEDLKEELRLKKE